LGLAVWASGPGLAWVSVWASGSGLAWVPVSAWVSVSVWVGVGVGVGVGVVSVSGPGPSNGVGVGRAVSELVGSVTPVGAAIGGVGYGAASTSPAVTLSA
jgi:hypothetical protein